MYETPPDGDFARYLEQLGERSATTLTRGARDAHVAATSRPSPRPVVKDEVTQMSIPKMARGLSVATLVRWAVVVFVALQILVVFVPRANILTLPLIVSAVAFVLYRFKKASSGALLAGLRRMSDQAAKEFNQRK